MTKLHRAFFTLWDRPGKELRPKLVYYFGESYGIDRPTLEPFAWAAEAVHTATLLHDDVIDRAETRRGGPSANELFDNTVPVLSGDYWLARAMERVAESGSVPLVRELCRSVREIVEGECLQYETRFTIPSLAVIERIATLKTAALVRWCGLVGPILADSPDRDEVEAFLVRWGRDFQRRDDVIDIHGNDGKPAWADLREGKINWAFRQVLDGEPALRRDVEKAFAARAIPPALVDEAARLSGKYFRGSERWRNPADWKWVPRHPSRSRAPASYASASRSL